MSFSHFYNISAPILIIGQTGSGKSHLAKQLYEASDIFKERFLTLNLASIKEELMESELYGHVKGSFTNATVDRNGYFQEVGEGTLFIDEIGELSLEGQKKFLYLLEEGLFTPLGSCKEVRFRGRILAATNQDLDKKVKEGTFRADLYFRLITFVIRLKPLAEDIKKLKELIGFFFNKYKKMFAKEVTVSDELYTFLLSYNYPGNIRELQNIVKYLLTFYDGILNIHQLPPWINGVEQGEKSLNIATMPDSFYSAMDEFASKYIDYKLHCHKGQVTATAKNIDLSKATLVSKIRKLNINIWEIKSKYC